MLGAQHIDRFDHHDELGVRFGVILQLEGFPGMVELRIATEQYPLREGYDPVTFEVPGHAALESWLRHLDAAGAEHSPIKRMENAITPANQVPTSQGVMRCQTLGAGR